MKRDLTTVSNNQKLIFDIKEYFIDINLTDLRKNIIAFNKSFGLVVGDTIGIVIITFQKPISSQIEIDNSYDSVFLEFSDELSNILWLSNGLVALSFKNGNIMCFSSDGSCVFEIKLHNTLIVQIRDIIEQNIGMLWILYEDGHLFMVKTLSYHLIFIHFTYFH